MDPLTIGVLVALGVVLFAGLANRPAPAPSVTVNSTSPSSSSPSSFPQKLESAVPFLSSILPSSAPQAELPAAPSVQKTVLDRIVPPSAPEPAPTPPSTTDQTGPAPTGEDASIEAKAQFAYQIQHGPPVPNGWQLLASKGIQFGTPEGDKIQARLDALNASGGK